MKPKVQIIPLPIPEVSAEVSDRTLVTACARGDEKALILLHRRHAEPVFRFLIRLMSADAASAEDALQRVFITVWKRASAFEGRATVRTWLFGIASNVARDHRRGHSRRERAMKRLALEPVPTVRHPEECVISKDLVAHVISGLDELSHPLRVVFLMCDVEDVPPREAATILGLRPGTVRRRLHQARGKLRARVLEKENEK